MHEGLWLDEPVLSQLVEVEVEPQLGGSTGDRETGGGYTTHTPPAQFTEW